MPVVALVIYIILVTLLMAVATAMPIGMAGLCLRGWRWLVSRMTSPVASNRILYWPSALSILWPLLFALLWLFWEMSSLWPRISDYFSIIGLLSLYFSLIIGLGLAIMWAASVYVACRLMIQWAAARQWRMALSTLILPLSFLLVLLGAPWLLKEIGTAQEYAQFFIAYPFYLAHLEKRSATEPQFIVWTSGDAYDDSAVLYDETDEIASDHPSEAWKKNAKEQGVICCKHQHIIGHFYWVNVTNVDLSEGDVRHGMMQGCGLYKSGRIAPGH